MLACSPHMQRGYSWCAPRLRLPPAAPCAEKWWWRCWCSTTIHRLISVFFSSPVLIIKPFITSSSVCVCVFTSCEFAYALKRENANVEVASSPDSKWGCLLSSFFYAVIFDWQSCVLCRIVKMGLQFWHIFILEVKLRFSSLRGSNHLLSG